MLIDVIKTFEKEYENKGENYITDSYVPADGEYVIVEPFENDFIILDRVIIKQDKKTREIDKTNQYFDFICKVDYMSKLLDMNKPIDPKKIIHSNNYLSFFIKKENLINDKLTDEVIENYYNIFKNPLTKYTKASAKKIFKEIEKKNGVSDEEKIAKIESWIKNNIYDLIEKDSKDKSYLKIFFKYDLEEYKKESEKYILTNIYNSNDFNVIIDAQIYGLPNDNMGLNAKKPYLENKSRKTKVPYLLSQKEVLMQKKFFDYLMNQVSIGNTNIYINEDKIKALPNDEMLNEDFSGYYLRIKKGKEVEVHDFDIIGLYKPIIKTMKLANVLKLEKSRLEYISINSMEKMKNVINEVFFSKFLTTNYFTEAKDLNIKDNCLKRNLLISRAALFSWFYKGNKNNIWKVLNFSSLDLIKGSINNGYLLKASEQFNLRCSLSNYFQGGDNMSDILVDVKNSLREKINDSNTGFIENDKEYYFAVGQLASYFISLSKGKNKVHSLVNPIINAKSDERIKSELGKMYKKYNYAISTSNKRFKNLFAMVSGYASEMKVEEDLIIAGYLHSNLIYEKMMDKEEE
ncbi:MAG: type I-B CRISPR-associated protein Cas8b/Csh1 [Clostridiaceae bacterium]